MRDGAMVSAILSMVNDPDMESVVKDVYLPMAKDAVMARLYPFEDEPEWDDVPERHHMATCQIASYLLSRAGAEGEVRHVEGGVTHEWASAGIPEAMLAGMVPMCGTLDETADSSED